MAQKYEHVQKSNVEHGGRLQAESQKQLMHNSKLNDQEREALRAFRDFNCKRVEAAQGALENL